MRTLKNQIKRWIRAERSGRNDEAEQLLGRLMVQLPDMSPAADFAATVLEACGLRAQRATRHPVWIWAARLVELMALTSAGLMALGVPDVVQQLRTNPPSALIDPVVRLMVASLARTVAFGSELLDGLSSVAYHAMLVSSTPEVMAGVTTLLITAFASLWTIQRVISVAKEESR